MFGTVRLPEEGYGLAHPPADGQRDQSPPGKREGNEPGITNEDFEEGALKVEGEAGLPIRRREWKIEHGIQGDPKPAISGAQIPRVSKTPNGGGQSEGPEDPVRNDQGPSRLPPRPPEEEDPSP